MIVLVSLTVKTIPHLQRVLDQACGDACSGGRGVSYGHGTDEFPTITTLMMMVRTNPRPTKPVERASLITETSSSEPNRDSSVDTSSLHSCLRPQPIQLHQLSRIQLDANVSGSVVLHQPSARRCGRLRRRLYWLKDSDAIDKQFSPPTSSSMSSPLAHHIRQHQENCSLGVATYHMDNTYGLGSHLYVWSQALCNAMELGYRLQTYNPSWIWSDQEYCSNEDSNSTLSQSPLLCYFPAAEQLCTGERRKEQPQKGQDVSNPNYALREAIASTTSSNQQPGGQVLYTTTLPMVNLSDPKQERHRCSWMTQQPGFLTDFRAASMEYLFHQGVSSLLIQEAERQIGLLFGASNTDDGTDPRLSKSSASKASLLLKPAVVPVDLIVVHMRWGDKFWEMDLAPASEYIHAVNQLLIARGQSINATANIYLSSEDPKAIAAFSAAAPSSWTVHVDRTVTELNVYRPTKGNRASWTTRNTKGRAGLVALGSLLVALEANDFVLTTKSNWSRLMNELRKNVIDPRCGNCTRMIDLRPGEW